LVGLLAMLEVCCGRGLMKGGGLTEYEHP